jgi:hypothetical protein
MRRSTAPLRGFAQDDIAEWFGRGFEASLECPNHVAMKLRHEWGTRRGLGFIH